MNRDTPPAWLEAALAPLIQAGAIPPNLPFIDISDTFDHMHDAPPHKGVFDQRTPITPPRPELILATRPYGDTHNIHHVTTHDRDTAPPYALTIRHDENLPAALTCIRRTRHILITRTYWVSRRNGAANHPCEGITWLDARGCILRHTIRPAAPEAPLADHLEPEEWTRAYAALAWPIRIALEALAREHRPVNTRTAITA